MREKERMNIALVVSWVVAGSGVDHAGLVLLQREVWIQWLKTFAMEDFQSINTIWGFIPKVSIGLCIKMYCFPLIKIGNGKLYYLCIFRKKNLYLHKTEVGDSLKYFHSSWKIKIKGLEVYKFATYSGQLDLVFWVLNYL